MLLFSMLVSATTDDSIFFALAFLSLAGGRFEF
jgi:hypothetical protein